MTCVKTGACMRPASTRRYNKVGIDYRTRAAAGGRRARLGGDGVDGGLTHKERTCADGSVRGHSAQSEARWPWLVTPRTHGKHTR
eukprot:3043948-Prymnesium_polylepis.1